MFPRISRLSVLINLSKTIDFVILLIGDLSERLHPGQRKNVDFYQYIDYWGDIWFYKHLLLPAHLSMFSHKYPLCSYIHRNLNTNRNATNLTWVKQHHESPQILQIWQTCTGCFSATRNGKYNANYWRRTSCNFRTQAFLRREKIGF